MEPTITVVLADDHPIFRHGLRQVIEADRRLEIVAEAADGQTAIDRIEDLKPDIAVLDLDMPNRDGFDVARAIRDKRLPTRVIFLTLYKDERFLNTALDAGVKGYLLKDGAVTEIVDSIMAVVAGSHYVSPALSTQLIERRRRLDAQAGKTPSLNLLTPVERKILGLIAEFKTSREIADLLCISPRTVDHHRANMAEKLDLRGSHALTRFAVELQRLPKKPD
jgi:DNA-binding NarL/FixJ family response regulator